MDDRLEGAGLENGLWTLSGTGEGNILTSFFIFFSFFFPSLLRFYTTKYFTINMLLLNRRSNFVFVKTLSHKVTIDEDMGQMGRCHSAKTKKAPNISFLMGSAQWFCVVLIKVFFSEVEPFLSYAMPRFGPRVSVLPKRTVY